MSPSKLPAITTVVQTTAATAQESAAASEELYAQVHSMKKSLEKFIV